MNYKFLPVLLFGLFSFIAPTKISSSPNLIVASGESSFESKVFSLYTSLNANNFKLPHLESFSKALEGFFQLKQKGLIQNDILTLVDFSLSANSKRLWVIDMNTNTIVFHTLVAHGRNSGEEYATVFSNRPESFKSSLGFYLTGETYVGKHGLSLRLDGLEKDINDKARDRAVVIHGADYVSEKCIKQNKRLGRSQACPALPVEFNQEIIELIKEKSCLFIYHPTRSYRIASKLIT